MSEAAATAATDTAAAGVTDTSATAAAAATTAATAADTGAATQAVLGADDDGAVTDGNAAEAEKADDAAKPGAPESYADFKVPDGLTMRPESLTAFKDAAKAMNLTQDQAQQLIDLEVARDSAKSADLQTMIKTEQDKWLVAAKADSEIGGEKFKENMAIAERAIDQFGTPELRTLLKETGMNRQAELLRFVYRVGKSISEDSFVEGGRKAPDKPVSLAQRIYPT